MMFLLLACATEASEYSDTIQPVPIYPIEGSVVRSQFVFQGSLLGNVSGSIAVLVWGEDGIEQEYSLLDTTEEFSYDMN